VRALFGDDGPPADGATDTAMTALRERYARGEIDDAEFERCATVVRNEE